MRAVFCGDFHSGHMFGLTPPSFFTNGIAAASQREMFTRYKGWVEKYHQPDVLVLTGDLIDGKAPGSGGSELITADRVNQVDMAIELVDMWQAKEIYSVAGTAYHSGKNEDWERIIASHTNAIFDDQIFVKMHNHTFHVRHHTGRSSVPYGKFTPVAKEALWQHLWAEKKKWPSADYIVRGHVHYYSLCEFHDWHAITCPALCGKTNYGRRRCNGLVDFGLLVFDITPEDIVMHKEIVPLHNEKPELHIVGDDNDHN